MDVTEKTEMTHSEQTRDRLLSSGLNLLAMKGYRGAVTREIAAGAGVTEMTLYRHFRSKDELFAEAISQNGEKLLELIPEPSGDIEVDLLQLSSTLVEQIHSIFMQLIRIVPELEQHGELKDQIDLVKLHFNTRLSMLIDSYQADNPTYRSDKMRYYMFIGPILLYLLDGVDTKSPFDYRQHVKMFLNGVFPA